MTHLGSCLVHKLRLQILLACVACLLVWTDLAASAPSTVKGVWVVSLMHLLALKCHAVKHGHKGRIVKDAEDVIQLIQMNGLGPEAEDIQDLFRKHGTTEFYEKVKRACGPG